MDADSFRVFIEQQKARGALDSSGAFTVDRRRANFKLAKYQLESPAGYLLKMVQLGVQLGCSEIEIHCNLDKVVLTLWSPSKHLSVGRVIQVLEDPLAQRGAMAALSTALNSAPAKKISCQDLSSGERVTITDSLVTSKAKAGSKPGFRFEFFRRERQSKVRAEEASALSQRCEWCPVPVTLDFRDLNFQSSRARAFNDSLTLLAFGTDVVLGQLTRAETEGLGCPGLHGWSTVTWYDDRTPAINTPSDSWVFVSCRDRPEPAYSEPDLASRLLLLSLEPRKAGTVCLVQHGVTLETREIPFECPGLLAALCVDGLETDLSGLQLIENAALKEAVESLRADLLYLIERIRESLPHAELLVTGDPLAYSVGILGAATGFLAGTGAAVLSFGLAGLVFGGPLGFVAGGVAATKSTQALQWGWDKATGSRSRATGQLVHRITCRLNELQHLN